MNPNSAYFLHQGLICKQVVQVSWSANAFGVLTFVGLQEPLHLAARAIECEARI